MLTLIQRLLLHQLPLRRASAHRLTPSRLRELDAERKHWTTLKSAALGCLACLQL